MSDRIVTTRAKIDRHVSGRHMQAYTGSPLDLAVEEFKLAYVALVEAHPGAEHDGIKITISSDIVKTVPGPAPCGIQHDGDCNLACGEY